MKRALRTNLILIWAFVVILTILGLTQGLSGSGLGATIGTFVSGLLATAIYFMPGIKDERWMPMLMLQLKCLIV